MVKVCIQRIDYIYNYVLKFDKNEGVDNSTKDMNKYYIDLSFCIPAYYLYGVTVAEEYKLNEFTKLIDASINNIQKEEPLNFINSISKEELKVYVHHYDSFLNDYNLNLHKNDYAEAKKCIINQIREFKKSFE